MMEEQSDNPLTDVFDDIVLGSERVQVSGQRLGERGDGVGQD